ncbi:hypothetical protein [Leptolyngbya iicbica]|uniref:Uncharacterized protein n=2 Tax=Cyanophyceae TaxID=3028117 RepID=A0A4Q7E2Z6_9CYAN|nr:hypothetical protein [Leptolyngbya sp. LK]RZM76066.1 hypothetical protein DYY88_19430 [Leptolyngbya sp. LK]
MNLLRSFTGRLVLGLAVGIYGLMFAVASPVSADNLAGGAKYMTADGKDVTAMVECLPESLSESDLDRALQESGNDFLEKVFDLKSDYDDYELDSTEVALLTCMQEKGVTPQVKQ